MQWPTAQRDGTGLARLELERWLMVEIPPPIPAQLHASSLLDAISPPNLKGTDLLGQSTFNPHEHDARLVSDSQGRTSGRGSRGRASARKGTTGTCGRKPRDQSGGTTSKRGARATERSRGPAVECARGAIAFDGFLDAADSQLGASIFEPFVLDEIERGCV